MTIANSRSLVRVGLLLAVSVAISNCAKSDSASSGTGAAAVVSDQPTPTAGSPASTAAAAPVAAPVAAQDPIQIFATKAQFPPCNAASASKLFYSVADHSMFVCAAGQFVASNAALPAVAASPSPSPGGASSAAVVNACGAPADPTVPDVVAVSGQLAISLPDDVSPCSASGYIVGYQSELPLKVAKDNSVYFDNTPPGKVDIIVTANGSSLALASDGSRGIRLSGVVSLPGVRRQIGDFQMPPTGAIAGVVQLASSNVADYAGILVYIPGTSYSAHTDGAGNYLITDVPAGTHNLYFDMDGFDRGDAEQIIVQSAATTSVAQITLILSTGSSGTFVIGNGVLSGGSYLIKDWNIDLNIAPTTGALLMMDSLDSGFNGAVWQPVITSTSLPFTAATALALEQAGPGDASDTTIQMPETFKVYMKFADGNGLESGVVSDNVVRDIFSAGQTPYVPTFQAVLVGPGTNSRSYGLTGINVPSAAANMMVSNNRYYGQATWGPTSTMATVPLSSTYSDCGATSLTVKFNDATGIALSAPGNPLAVANACDKPIAATNAPAPLSSQDDAAMARYGVTWTGSDMAVVGFSALGVMTGGLFDPVANVWTPISATGAPSGRGTFALTGDADHLAVLGGYDLSGSLNPLSDILVYSAEAGTWTSSASILGLPNAPGSRQFATSAVATVGHTLIVWSGTGDPNGAGGPGIGERYDFIAGTWEPMSITGAALSARVNPIALVINGKVVIAGGSNSTAAAIYDPTGDTWTAAAPLPVALDTAPSSSSGFMEGPQFVTTTVDADHACVFGADGSSNKYIFCYSLAGNSWTETAVNSTQFSFPDPSKNAFAVAGTKAWYYIARLGRIYQTNLTDGTTTYDSFNSSQLGVSPVFMAPGAQYAAALSVDIPGVGLAAWSGIQGFGMAPTSLGAIMELH